MTTTPPPHSAHSSMRAGEGGSLPLWGLSTAPCAVNRSAKEYFQCCLEFSVFGAAYSLALLSATCFMI